MEFVIGELYCVMEIPYGSIYRLDSNPTETFCKLRIGDLNSAKNVVISRTVETEYIHMKDRERWTELSTIVRLLELPTIVTDSKYRGRWRDICR